MTPTSSTSGGHPAASRQAANEDFFMKIDGIVGESKDTKHPREIQVTSWGWGATVPTEAGTGQRVGRVAVQTFTIEMPISKASVQLWKGLLSGQKFKTAVFCARKAGGTQEDYIQITFENARVVKIEMGNRIQGDQRGPIVTEIVTLAFSKFDYIYREQTERGGLAGSFEVVYELTSASTS